MPASHSKHPGALLTALVFLASALSLSAVRPLWLDEILQLMETRQSSTVRLLVDIRRAPGAAPLGYLVQQAGLRITGYSALRARLTPALFSAATVYLVVLLAAETGLHCPWLAGFVFAAFPLTLRYATESRMYSQAQFFSVLATLFYIRLIKKPGWPLAAAYCLALSAAVYTQPYAGAVGMAHVIWSALSRNRRTTLMSAAAFAIVGISFLPWYLWSKNFWSASITGTDVHFHVSMRTPLMLFRESIGAGYWGSGVLLLLCAKGLLASRLTPQARWFQALTISTILICVLCADALFNYYIAAREFLWMLPALAILGAAAIDRRERATLVLCILLCVFCARQSLLFFTTPGEDWQAAADSVLEKVHRGAGLAIVPPAHAPLYEFFDPALRHAPRASSWIVMAISPYATSQQRRSAIAALTTAGYEAERETMTGKSEIICLRHRLP